MYITFDYLHNANKTLSCFLKQIMENNHQTEGVK